MHKDLDKLADFLIDHPQVPVSNLRSYRLARQGRFQPASVAGTRRCDQSLPDLSIQIESARIEAHGYGSSKPIVNEATDDDRSLNRRVEFEIKKK